MAVAFVKNVGSGTFSMSTSSVITVPAAGVAAGNLLVVRVRENIQGTVTVEDTGGNTYTERRVQSWLSRRTHVFESAVATALVSGNTITATFAKADGETAVDEWSGVGTFDTTTGASGTSATPSSGAITPAGVGLIVGTLGAGENHTEDTDSDGGDTWHGLTAPGDGYQNDAAYKITTSAVSQSYDPTIAASAGWGCAILAWNEAVTDTRVPYSTSMPQLLAH